MRMTRNAALLGGVLVAAACGRQDFPPPDKLDDLAWLDSLTFPSLQAVASPEELGVELEPEPVAEAPAPRAPAPRATSRPAPQRSAAPRPAPVSYPTSQGTYGTPAPAPARTESNAKRDAAIGAGAGVVIGATVAGSGNRVRGAIVGGAAGAVVGGVIGHTVNRRTVQP
jgi:hypothetical protein